MNNSGETRSYSLSAQSPSGWQVAFRPSGESTQVASIELEPGASQGLTVAVTPPDNVAAGEYTIPCSAISGSETLDMELSVTITEQYQMDLSTPDGLLSFSAQAGADSNVTLSITNNGNVAIENVNLTSSTPSGWNVSFDTPTVDVIEAGETAQVTAHVTPSDEALTGDYVVTITASTSETSSKLVARTLGSCSLIGTFFIISIIRHLRNVRSRHDGSCLPAAAAWLFPLLSYTSAGASWPDQSLPDGRQTPVRPHRRTSPLRLR